MATPPFEPRILVADDDKSIQQLICTIVGREGIQVDCVGDGMEAIEKLKTHSYSLILLDLMMPRLNGYEFIERIGKTVLSHRPHIVVFTAAGKRGVEKIPADAVCNSILKPFDLDKFIEIISDCLNQSHETTSIRSAE